MSEDDNPFENVPDDFADGEAEVEHETGPEIEHHSTVERRHFKDDDMGQSPANFKDLPRLAPEVANKGKLAMVAGFGFVMLAVIVYLGIILPGKSDSYVFGILGMILSALIAFFYMLDDLRIRPLKLTERGTRFIAGIIWALLLLLAFIMTNTIWPDYVSLIYLYMILILTNASFALFFYSMLWEE